MRLARRAAAGLLLVALGLLLSPTAVPVYDGIGQPDEPYRWVARPEGAQVTADPTVARATSPVANGLASYGLNVATAEVGPQFSLFLPPRAVRVTPARAGATLTVTATPQATVTDPPPGTRADGNAYLVELNVPGAQPSLTPQAALATLQMRATTAKQPPPTIQYRPSVTAPWQALTTARAGTEIYAAVFPGPGQFQIAFAVEPGSSTPVLPYVVVGMVVLVGVVVLVVRLRASA